MKLFVFTKKSVILYASLFAFVTMLIAFNWSNTVSVFQNGVKRDLPIYSVDKQEKVMLRLCNGYAFNL